MSVCVRKNTTVSQLEWRKTGCDLYCFNLSMCQQLVKINFRFFKFDRALNL